jgi:hypothetical protein
MFTPDIWKKGFAAGLVVGRAAIYPLDRASQRREFPREVQGS